MKEKGWPRAKENRVAKSKGESHPGSYIVHMALSHLKERSQGLFHVVQTQI